ncbi:ATP-binding protein [Primorskyibacter flagellatus]|uniref:ATP-binding protein n=1 Tax=Primorskyibacter flagellatus TaxID=1387277 RepID=UPI003A93CC2E
MQHLTLKWRVLLLIASVHLLVMLSAGYVLLDNARTAVAREITAAQESAAILIRDFAGQRTEDMATFADDLRTVIAAPRHVRIRYVQSNNSDIIELAVSEQEDEDAPEWFLDWVAPEIPAISIPVGSSPMKPFGAIEVIANPDDEAAEVWEDVEALFFVWIGATGVLLIALTVLVGQAFAPLKQFERALARLTAGDYSHRLDSPPSPDLMEIWQGIVTLAASLEASEDARRTLSSRLLELREDERRVLARELHDELGPCLFGLSVMADGLRNASGGVGEKAEDIDLLVSRIRSANRRILDTLRPATIGNLPLKDVVTDLVAQFACDHPEVHFHADISGSLPPTSDVLDATVYRTLQEAMVNALRHGQPSEIRIRLTCKAERELAVEVTDNGCGLASGWQEGRGLLGMRERVDAFNGRFFLTGQQGNPGACLHASFRIQP